METFGIFLFLWLIYLVCATVLSGPILYFGRKRIRFQRWELLILILPFIAWAALMNSDLSTGNKTLSNLVEPFYFAWAVPTAALIRVLLGSKIPERLCATCLIATVCIVSVTIFFIVPPLPE